MEVRRAIPAPDKKSRHNFDEMLFEGVCLPYCRHPCSAASFQAPSGGEKRLSPGSPEPSEPSEPFGTRGRVRGPFSRGDGANLESREARVTQIRGLDVATLARFGRSENSAWGWRKSGVLGSKSHTDSWPRCRHAAAVWPLLFLLTNWGLSGEHPGLRAAKRAPERSNGASVATWRPRICVTVALGGSPDLRHPHAKTARNNFSGSAGSTGSTGSVAGAVTPTPENRRRRPG